MPPVRRIAIDRRGWTLEQLSAVCHKHDFFRAFQDDAERRRCWSECSRAAVQLWRQRRPGELPRQWNNETDDDYGQRMRAAGLW
jgi:hypothetical protein